MKVLILNDAESATQCAGDIVLRAVASDPQLILGLATGGTMEPLYDHLCNHSASISFAGVTTFNLDEYVGLPPAHPHSYHSYMQRHLFARLDIDPARTFLPRGDASDPQTEALRYDQAIATAGGIGLQVLGLGANGHIGFNEPTSSLGSRTRIKTLTEKTRADNARFFETMDDVPRYAITMGIATILDARQIVLLATGKAKAQAVANMIEGPVAAICPASVLQFHQKVTVVLDESAASALAMRDYFVHVHPNGMDPTIRFRPPNSY
jgi:glucosamine-6-phosphate deaminase